MLIASLDTETTGFVEPDHRIVEVYIDLIDSSTRKVLYAFEQRINPKRNMPAEAQRVHGIAMSDLMNMPDWEQVGPMVHKIVGKSHLVVAHNARFDVEFLNMEFRRIGLSPIAQPNFCTMENGIWATPIGKKPSLMELCFACDVPYDPSLAHAAAYDVRRMNECLFRGLDWGFYQLPGAASQSLAA
jgi:DNA polymerase III subunit epsilon